MSAAYDIVSSWLQDDLDKRPAKVIFDIIKHSDKPNIAAAYIVCVIALERHRIIRPMVIKSYELVKLILALPIEKSGISPGQEIRLQKTNLYNPLVSHSITIHGLPPDMKYYNRPVESGKWISRL